MITCPLSLRGSNADAACSASAPVGQSAIISILWRKRMAFVAMGFLGIVTGGSSIGVLAQCDRPEMRGVYATPIAAQMVNDKILWNWPYEQLICEAMRLYLYAFDFAGAERNDAISSSGTRAVPFPTSSRFIKLNGFGKAIPNRLGRSSNPQFRGFCEHIAKRDVGDSLSMPSASAPRVGMPGFIELLQMRRIAARLVSAFVVNVMPLQERTYEHQIRKAVGWHVPVVADVKRTITISGQRAREYPAVGFFVQLKSLSELLKQNFHNQRSATHAESEVRVDKRQSTHALTKLIHLLLAATSKPWTECFMYRGSTQH